MINPNQDSQSALDRILEQEMADILIDDYGRTLCEHAAQEAIEDAVLSPPCGEHVSDRHYCPECGAVLADEREETINDYVCKVDSKTAKIWSYKPRELDSTRIDWHSRSHTNSSMIKEGIYPEGVSQTEVHRVVDGTFGGRFDYFGGGKFKFIAYTD